jgi:tetratricopeptide (TPR) repeat protein
MTAATKRGSQWWCGCLVVLLCLAAGPGWGAAPPVPSGKLKAEQQKRLVQLDQELAKAAFAGRMGEALRLARQVEVLRRRWQGARHWQTIDACREREEWQRLVRLSEAEQKEAVRALRHSVVAQGLRARHRYAEAEQAWRDVLTTSRKILGEEHPVTASSYDGVASSLSKRGKHAQALPLFEKALLIFRKVLGEGHPTTATSYNNAAYCLDEQGKHAQAQPLYEKALAIRRKVLGEEHPDTARSYSGLASCLNAHGKYAQALPLHEKALAIRRKALGDEHPDTASSYNNVAFCLDSQGRHAQALPLYEKALAIRRKVLGEEHPNTATSYNNLACCLDRQGKYAQALPVYEKALAIFRKVRGEEHLSTALGYNALACCLDRQREYVQALPLDEKALAIRRKVLGEEHPDTATSYNGLAHCLKAQGKYAEALPLYEKALAIHRKVLGEEHPHTALVYNNLACCLDAQGKHAQALPLFEKTLAIFRKVLGEEHPDTAGSYHNLGLFLQAQVRYREAIRFWQAALLGHDAGRLARASSGFDRSLYGAHFLTPRQGLVLAHAGLKEPALAWQHAEADLARGLLDDLGGGLGENAAVLAEVKKLDERLLPLLSAGKLSREQDRLRQDLTSQRRELLERLARDLADRSTRLLWPLSRIQKHLPSDTALVLWVSGRDENLGCVVRAQGQPRWQRLSGTGPKGSWTENDYQRPWRLYAALADRNSSDSRRRELSEEVRQRWLAPLVKHLGPDGKLPAVRRLFVVPAGYLSALPVEAIAPEWTISYTPSGTLLAQTLAGHRPLDASSVLALGDPAFTPAKKADPPAHGLLITVVLPGSNAARAGLRNGDVLLDYRGTDLHTVDDLQPLLARPGRASATLWRDGRRQGVRLPAGPLGVVFDRRSARAAVRAWRRNNDSLLRGDSYQALPGTRFEVEALRRLLGKRCRLLLGSDASEQRLDALGLKQFRVLHLATHGKIDPDTPANSALILSRDRLPSLAEQAERAGQGQKVYTGELRVGTILKEWRLDADLVVLSACETGLGRHSSGQGLLGFAYALQVAGARSVVLSRWKVDDTATALLMLRFYENLLGARKGTKSLGRARALAEARSWLRELSRKEAGELAARHAGGVLRGTEGEARPLLGGKPAKLPEGEKPFAHPAFWAAFTLLGDPD